MFYGSMPSFPAAPGSLTADGRIHDSPSHRVVAAAATHLKSSLSTTGVMMMRALLRARVAHPAAPVIEAFIEPSSVDPHPDGNPQVMFSEFLAQLEAGQVDMVTFANDSAALQYRLKAAQEGAAGQLCTTVAVAGAREDLLKRLVEKGIAFGQGAASRLSRLSSFLILCIPFLYIACMAWVLNKLHNPKVPHSRRL